MECAHPLMRQVCQCTVPIEALDRCWEEGGGEGDVPRQCRGKHPCRVLMVGMSTSFEGA